MKKLIFSLILITIFANTIHADTYVGSYSMSVNVNKVPEYVIKIPTSVDVSNNETTINYYIMGDIYADQTLTIKFDEQVIISNSSYDMTLNVTQDKTTFSHNELTNSFVTYTATITHDKLSSGNWTGRLNLMISLMGGA